MVCEAGFIEGMALRLFNPKTKLWSIYWANSETAMLDSEPIVGSMNGPIGHFYGRDQCNGKKILVQFEWDATDKDHPVWKQAFSVDQGKTWEWNWIMSFQRTIEAPRILPDKHPLPAVYPGFLSDINENQKIPSQFSNNGALKVETTTSVTKKDLVFLMGRHYVRHRILTSRLKGGQQWREAEGIKETFPILQGLGNIELHQIRLPENRIKEGIALRLCQPSTRQWQLYWTDSESCSLEVPQTGSFSDHPLIFLPEDNYQEQDILVPFQYNRFDQDSTFPASELFLPIRTVVEKPVTLHKSYKNKITEEIHRQSIQLAMLYLQQHFSKDLHIHEMAKQACMSAFHFCRIFKQFTGQAPHQYLLQIRLMHAEKLLRETDLPITDVCYRSGFSRLDYFSYVFSKTHMETPSRYRLRFQQQAA
ncbi:MAG: helix-turn-helix domain-containing protein [Flavisolibacter sp.]